MGISAISLFENNGNINELYVYLLGENISNENKEILKGIADKYNRKIVVIDVLNIDIPKSLISDRWPLSAFTRLYAGQLLPESIDKVLYLDCDTIVKGDISDLENTDISSKIFWGIKDCIGKLYKENIGLDGNDIYINAGVLLINLPKLRTINLTEQLSSYIQRYEKLINYADQDVLNGAFHDVIGFLPLQYDVMTIAVVYGYDGIQKLRNPTNYYSKAELQVALQNPVIIHYTTNMRTIRPWFTNTDHPFADKFRYYLNISPWRDRELRQMSFTSIEAKIIGLVEKLPKKISIKLLGLLHSSIKPRAIRIKAREKG